MTHLIQQIYQCLFSTGVTESLVTIYVRFGSILFEYYVTFPVFNVVLSNTSDGYVQFNGQNSLEAQYTILLGPFYHMFDVGISMTRHFICLYGTYDSWSTIAYGLQ